MKMTMKGAMYTCAMDVGWVWVDGLEFVKLGEGHVLVRSGTRKDILKYDMTNNHIPRCHLWHESCENYAHSIIGLPDSRNTSLGLRKK